jgi:two-component system chemotaxis sensor kinase CheA
VNEFLEQFLEEGRELVEQGVADLLALEADPSQTGALDGAFRAFHTLKGAAGIVDFDAMGRALHAAEDVLAAARAGRSAVSAGLIGNCLGCLDQVVVWLDQMQAAGEVPPDADAAADALVARFGGEQGAVNAPLRPPASGRAPRADVPASASALPEPIRELLEAQRLMLGASGADGVAGRMGSAALVAANLLRHLGRPGEASHIEQMARAPAGLSPLIEAIGNLLAGTPLAPAAGPPGVGPPGLDQAAAPEPAARSLRVDVGRIDALVSVAGELGVASNALAHAASAAAAGADPGAVARLLKSQQAGLARLVERLQHAVLQMRVLPLRQVFQRFPRLVREMAVNLGKPAGLVIEGEATEADKVIVEALFEPLLHVLRNAVDHGVESAEARAAAGKPPTAVIHLRARSEAGQVVVEVEDDGGGVDLARVRQLAAERDLASKEDLAGMNDEEVTSLIFAPGFSTAREVSSLSGRGVGMDAVRVAIERLAGRVTIASRAGRGSLVRFTLPFSVMMNQVMTVEAGGQIFGIPLEGVLETVRLPRERILPLGSGRAVVLRDRTVPVIALAEATGGDPEATGGADAAEASLVVAMAGGRIAGLEVDRLGERMDVILKPLDGLLSGTPGVAGAALLGDGRVLLVLDLQALLQ